MPAYDCGRSGSGHDGAQPDRLKGSDFLRRSSRIGDAVDQLTRPRRAEAALSAADGQIRESRGVRPYGTRSRSFEAVEFATLEWVDWFNNRRLLEPIGNIPKAEADEHYYAILETPAMAACLKPNGLRQTRGGSPSRPLQPIRKDLVIRFRRQRLAREAIMAAKEISVKKYVVRLSGEERERLETLIRKGKSPARRVLKARILLKADVSEAGKGWSDNRIIEALETSPSMVYRVRKQLVEEGFEAVLSRKPRAMPAITRIFDGENEAKLIALACSKPPKGRARWTLRLLENKVVELGIVDRASDSTIGRALKKTLFSPIAASTGSSRRRPTARRGSARLFLDP